MAKPGAGKRDRERRREVERKDKASRRAQRQVDSQERKAQGLDAVPIVERELPPL
jgi:hypothetical protein